MNVSLLAPDRRQVLATMTAAGALGACAPAIAAASVGSDAIRPFAIAYPEGDLADLRRRIVATRLPEREIVADDTQGVQIATLQALGRYWATKHDWRRCEAQLNVQPQFITTIDGLDIHFIHVRSKHPNALPIIVTHGWPGSIIEQLKVIAPLTDPTAYGGSPADAFDVVIPSLPGYGFSGKPMEAGWDATRIASAWITLMRRLGYARYVAQGGDWGNYVVEQMALRTPPALLGIHTNMPGAVPDEITEAVKHGLPAPAGLSADEQRAFDQLAVLYDHGFGYAQEMGNRPQTLYGIADSPLGLAAWMLDHDAKSYALIGRAFAGLPEGLTRDEVLDNITLYWLTRTAVSSARLYWQSRHVFCAPKDVTIPVAVSAFPDELYTCPESWAKRAYRELIHYNRLPKGGHFAAWEQPALFTTEMRSAFRTLR